MEVIACENLHRAVLQRQKLPHQQLTVYCPRDVPRCIFVPNLAILKLGECNYQVRGMCILTIFVRRTTDVVQDDEGPEAVVDIQGRNKPADQ